MSDCQKVCEEIIEAAGKATARPWAHGKERSDTDASLWAGDDDCLAYFHAPGPADEIDLDDDCLHQGHRDVRYTAIAANNAARLARMLLTLEDDPGLSIEYLWEQSE